MHMSTKKQTFKQLSETIGVSYRTLLAWRKTRPELVDYLLMVNQLQHDNDALKSKLSVINKITRE